MIFAVMVNCGEGEQYRKLCLGIYPDMVSAQPLAERYPGSVILAEHWQYEPAGELNPPMDLTRQPDNDEVDDNEHYCPHCGRWD